MDKYKLIGIIDATIEERGPNYFIRGSNPSLYIAISILDVLYELGVISYNLYDELFTYYQKKN